MTLIIMTPSSPTTPQKHQPYDPHVLQSTSSLFAGCSSPVQTPGSAHRSSRSMGSLNNVLEHGDPAHSSLKGKGVDKSEVDDRRRSVDSPGVRKLGRRSETLPDWLVKGKEKGKEKGINLPGNPKHWAPSDLAQYLTYELRTGGPDGAGKILPAPLIADIECWVLRQRVSGTVFLDGSSEGWGNNTSRAPPFIPLLQTIARRLHRRSLLDPHSLPNSRFPQSPTLLEEDETSYDDGSTGVRRMAKAYDARSSASESSFGCNDESEPPRLVAQHTGDSVIERWRRWEVTGEALKPSEHEEFIQGYGRKRNLSDASSSVSHGSATSAGVGRKSPTIEEMLEDMGEKLNDEDEDTVRATLKAPLKAADPIVSPDGRLHQPAISEPSQQYDPLEDKSKSPNSNIYSTSERRSIRSRTSVAPAREHTTQPSGLDVPTESDSKEVTPSATPSKAKVLPPNESLINGEQFSKNVRRYATLGKSSANRGHPHQLLSLELDDRDADEQDGGNDEGYWETARKVTLRPTRAAAHDLSKADIRPADKVKEEKEKKIEEQMAQLMERIKDLEERLQNTTSSNTPTPIVPVNVPFRGRKLSLLDLLGWGKDEDDDLPRRVKELPAYLFLVGVGVGAIMVGVILRRR
ncbi:hypothetical protein C366_02029 [Cryptococcus neoformans Tu401-1]|nr:hypothetical protein C365_02235 [Cryptococcus neoformans var. grubii Bt85]OXG20495.1 hypothetical protein C366_02029 [Cryptococcus neoformans var. grubii Tu401-1]